MRLIVRPEAEADIELGFRWYEEQFHGLGDDFLELVEQQLFRIVERPDAYPVVHPRVRRSLMPRFPYAVFFVVQGEAIAIIAVSHQARDAEHWQSRI